MDENGECSGGGGNDLMIWCECGAGICSVEPLIMNRRFLFVCCPKGPADGGGCGFMQWRDTVDLTNITTWNNNYSSPPPPSTTAAADTPPHPITTDTDTDTPPNPITTDTDTDTDTPPNPITTAAADTPPIPTAAADTTSTDPIPVTTTTTPPLASQDVPASPPPQMMMCPCGAGACSIGTAKNGRNFYSCSSCKFRKWCDAGSSSQCYICREEGHWSMDCPRLPPTAAAAAANNKKICFYCKQEDHYAAQCPFKYRTRRRN